MNRKYNFEFLFIIIWNNCRRIAHGRGSLSSHRTRRHNNPASSSSGPPASGQPGSGLSALSTLSPSARDAVDPIAELLSQLSGVRRVAGSSSSQLQQLQMELQVQRQQQRQTLDRLARRPPASSSAAPVTVPAVHAAAPAVGQSRPAGGSAEAGDRSGGCGGHLLSGLVPDDQDEDASHGQEQDRKQELFLTDLLLGALSLQSEGSSDDES